MANTPLKMTIPQAELEVEKAWSVSYSAQQIEKAIDSISDKPIDQRVMHLIVRLTFRGIYFPQMSKLAWMKLVLDNRRPIYRLAREGFGKWRATRRRASTVSAATS